MDVDLLSPDQFDYVAWDSSAPVYSSLARSLSWDPVRNGTHPDLRVLEAQTFTRPRVPPADKLWPDKMPESYDHVEPRSSADRLYRSDVQLLAFAVDLMASRPDIVHPAQFVREARRVGYALSAARARAVWADARRKVAGE